MTQRTDEDGFTMIATVIGMSLLALLVLVAVTAVNGDAQLTTRDLTRKQAYEAAKAGIDEYAFHLHSNSAYWSKCTGVEGANALNQIGVTSNRRSVPGMPEAKYAVELIPATGHSSCDPSTLSTATESMIQSLEPLKGTFRIRSNGYAGQAHVAIMATFKPATFLDYVYFTQYETSDPRSYANSELRYGAEQQCAKFIRDGRTETPLKNKAGQIMNESGGVWISGRQKYCEVISFVGGDNIKGPMHTNDAFVICNNPILGRGPNDPIEVGAKKPGWYSTGESFLHAAGSSCSGSPQLKGQFLLEQPVIVPPASNGELKNIAAPEYRFSGEVSICFEGATMRVNSGRVLPVEGVCPATGEQKPFPANGVIYVSSIECNGAYTPFLVKYEAAPASKCGNVNVSGSYSKPLTIAAANDILITGNVTKTSEEGLLGMIANNFIRIYHPVKIGIQQQNCHLVNGVNVCEEVEVCESNASGILKNLKIEAALLAIEHSFIVDNFNCGSSLEKLNVTGAIAQKFRGAVGTTGGTGYIKNYEYDERLKTTEPPSFIQPIESDWVIGRETTE